MAEAIKVPTTYLPADWKEQGAAKFSCSNAKIEKVVYGQMKDLKITAFMLDLAEKGKKSAIELEQQLKSRAEALNH